MAERLKNKTNSPIIQHIVTAQMDGHDHGGLKFTQYCRQVLAKQISCDIRNFLCRGEKWPNADRPCRPTLLLLPPLSTSPSTSPFQTKLIRFPAIFRSGLHSSSQPIKYNQNKTKKPKPLRTPSNVPPAFQKNGGQ